MMASSSSSSTGTFYKIIDISGNRINTIAFFEDYMGDNILPDVLETINSKYLEEKRVEINHLYHFQEKFQKCLISIWQGEYL